MRNELDPIVGEWYQRRDKGEMFRVVAAIQSHVEEQGTLSQRAS